jgi:hypothetical protein|tara:strand:- start:130 stop:765 length:636 start_codon:yes stop_codon:yes gene_type:complete
MNDDPRTEPLREWNRLARENTENAIVSSMFEAGSKSSEPIEQFSTWLLVGTAAIASFLIANSDKLVPLITTTGFLVCGAFLCLSCMSGFISKIYAVRLQIGIKVGGAIRETFSVHLEEYEKEKEEINDGASFWGITLETGIRIERVLEEFFKPQPQIVKWFAMRIINKHQENPQIGYLIPISMINRQSFFAILQALLFLGFLVSGFIYAAI